MTETKKTIHDSDLNKVYSALLRSAQKARKIAMDTQTPLVIYKDGRIIRQHIAVESQKTE